MRSTPAAVGLRLACLLVIGSCHSARPVGVIGYAEEAGFGHVIPLAAELIAEDTALAGRVAFRAAAPPPDSATAGDVRAAVDLTQQRGLSAVLGPGSSRGMLAAAPIYEEARIPVVTPTATSRLVERAGPWTFMLAPNDSAEGAFLARVAVERFHARRVTIFHVTDEYGTGLRDGIVAELARLDVKPLDVRILPDTPGWCTQGGGPTRSFRGVLQASLRSGVADVVIAATRDLGTGCLARQLREFGALRRIVAGDGTLATEAMFLQAGPAADSIYAAAFWHPERPEPQSLRFVRRYRARFGALPNHGEAMRFDAVMLLVEAIRQAGPAPAAVRNWLTDLGRGHPAYTGVTGPIAFGAGREAHFTLIHADAATRSPRLLP